VKWLRTTLAVLLVVGLSSARARADVVFLTNGDRISGKIMNSGNRKSYLVLTSFGRLNVPRAKIWKIEKSDGSEEVLNPPGAAAPATARLILVIMGSTFWQAWDPRDAAGLDPALRFEVRLDEETIASYVDGKQDPDEIPKAVVNSFSFNPGDVVLEPAAGVQLPQPEARPGRIVLKVDVPVPAPGAHRLRVSYQTNGGTSAEPSWKDLATSESSVQLTQETPTFLQVKQDRGRMEFGGFPRKKMKLVETFKLNIQPDTGS
jgi:hypothetical protein